MLLFLGTFDVHRRDWRALLRRMRLLRLGLKRQKMRVLGMKCERLDDEIQFHLDHQIAENIAAGMNREEARHGAMRAFGNPTILKEETRDSWGWVWPENVGGVHHRRN